MDMPVKVLITENLAKPLISRIQGISNRLELHAHPAKTADDLPPEVLAGAEILFTLNAVPQPEQAPRLRWVQFHMAGLDRFAEHPLLQTGVQFTSLSGAAAPQMAEYILLMLLALGHRMPEMILGQAARGWGGGRWSRFSPRELRGSTVGLVGYGSVAREAARLCRPFGARILAVKRDITRPADDGFALPGLGDPEGCLPIRMYPPAGLRRMLAECDFVVICAPLHSGTRHWLDADVLGAMRPGAFLINVSRGGIVDEAALSDALQKGKIGGAALDVTETEPLPPESPLWSAPNLLLSPHIAGDSPQYDARAVEVFAANLRRYLAGQPLLNRFDPSKGY
jgi:phosphoglycerate dehydrogenase-like enzyme